MLIALFLVFWGLAFCGQSTQERKAEVAVGQQEGPLADRKAEILASLAISQSNLEKARLYGATSEQLEPLGASLQRAAAHIEANRLEEADRTLKQVDPELLGLIASLEPGYASRLLEQARDFVSKAEESLVAIGNSQAGTDQAGTDQAGTDQETSPSLDTLKEQVAVSKEARDSAESFLNQEKYLASIQESEDAIRLSEVVLEQSALLIASRSRDAVVEPKESKGPVEDIGKGWKRYTVQRQQPADCLWCIARRQDIYGRAELWSHIYKANRKNIPNPNLIYPGQVFYIPPPDGDPTEKPPLAEMMPEEALKEEQSADMMDQQEAETPEAGTVDKEASASEDTAEEMQEQEMQNQPEAETQSPEGMKEDMQQEQEMPEAETQSPEGMKEDKQEQEMQEQPKAETQSPSEEAGSPSPPSSGY